MSYNTKKFLDIDGVKYLISLLDDYPNNSILGTIIDSIEEAIDDIYQGKPLTGEGSANKINPAEIEEEMLLAPNGELVADSRYTTTGYIEVEENKSSVGFTGLNAANTKRVCLPTARIIFFNDQKTVISYVNDIPSNTISSIPAETKYVRVCAATSYFEERMPMVEFINSISEISTDYVEYVASTGREPGLDYLNQQQQILASTVETLSAEMATNNYQNINAIIPYGLTWNWWITANSIDEYGNVYIGYVDTEGYAGVLRRQSDGVMQYKRLEKSYNNDDHNGMATLILDNGQILVIGSYGHGTNNHMICYKSKNPYSIDEMEKLSFDIPQGETYSYKITYSQVFKYNNKIFDFCRCTVTASGENSTTGYLCLISEDNGSTWTAYQAVYTSDPYITFAQCTDDNKYIKLIYGVNPSSGTNTFKGAVIDLSTYKIYDLNNIEIGEMTALGTNTYNQTTCAKPADMTNLIAQTIDGKKGRLFTVAETEKANTIFLYATAIDTNSSDFIYKLYNNGTVIEIGTSGVAFGNTHYISGICFGNSTNTIYYSKAITAKADGPHELHKVKINGSSVASDEIIAEASMCILRPLFLGNGAIAAVVGHYNDQTENGYNGSFVNWKLKPFFTHA